MALLAALLKKVLEATALTYRLPLWLLVRGLQR